jgi:hypothetical protein
MSKAKGKGGTGRGTDSKGWNRWKSSSKAKPVGKSSGTSQGIKGVEGTKSKSGKIGVNVDFGTKIKNVK